jgi:hypothetical protein
MVQSTKASRTPKILYLVMEDGRSYKLFISISNSKPYGSILTDIVPRICPGRYIGYDSAWLAIASLVAVFDISTITDPSTGKQVPDINEHEYKSTIAV